MKIIRLSGDVSAMPWSINKVESVDMFNVSIHLTDGSVVTINAKEADVEDSWDLHTKLCDDIDEAMR